jgi:hypothetical protein
MPVSKPNRRWSKHRRWQERRAVAKSTRGAGDPAGGVVHTGASVFDPVTNYQKLGRFQGTMIAAALQDMKRARSVPSMLGWMVVGALLLGVGAVFLYGAVNLRGGALNWAFAATFPIAGGLILSAQIRNGLRLLNRRQRHSH